MRVIGWREWVALPALGIERIKAKVDSGARTSALHAFAVEVERRQGQLWVRFGVHPVQRRSEPVVWSEVPVLDRRVVRDSGGHEEERYVIETAVRIGKELRLVEVTLTDRDNMGFRMLLGRTALRGDYLIDPGRSYLAGRRTLASPGLGSTPRGKEN
ncbi:MAG: ATP-dependent zinc protease [Pseudomonadales bacterium]